MRTSLTLVTLAVAALGSSACKDPNANGTGPTGTSTTSASSALTPSASASGASGASGAAAATQISAPNVVAASELKEGGPAPDFAVTATDGAKLSLASLKGKPLVVYFYPKDETSGCTVEAESFRDSWKDMKKSNVTMIGVSTDSDDSHKAFAEKHKLPFHLVSDPKGELAAKFGVPVRGNFASRETFVIDKDGKVKKIYKNVDVQKHAAEILNDVKS